MAGEGGDPYPKSAYNRTLTEKNRRLPGGEGAMNRFLTLVYP
jgi:hypothetical protein